ncbi:MAG: hypothetical protein H7X93_10180 [Sphingomonadaceae bacterium]|nr:hypothetical protein [Sphingomonadaceae bacterium]
MTTFNRTICGYHAENDRETIIRRIEAAAKVDWFGHLLELWQPAGHDKGVGTGPTLRLAIRNGYMNFYSNGQSVAKVSLGPRCRPRASIHIKYVAEGATEQKYATLAPDGRMRCTSDVTVPAQYKPGMVDGWIEKTARYAGQEKKFVERVVAANPAVVDLEMGLPALSKGESASRMDLVALEPDGNNYRLVFWEAKLMDDGRLRSRAEPEVITQMRDYQRWFAKDPQRRGQVLEAYRRCCFLLSELAKVAGSKSGDVGGAIERIARDPQLLTEVDDKPRLLVFDPDRRKADSWSDHQKILKSHMKMYEIVPPHDFSLSGAAN